MYHHPPRGRGPLFEMTIWALLFVFCGEFARFAGAFYHFATNYTTLGYGDYEHDLTQPVIKSWNDLHHLTHH